MRSSGIGASVKRVEDARFITGRGQYVDSIHLPRECYGYIVLSPVAHARISSIDTTPALELPGVVCVLTGKDVEDDKLGAILPNFMPKDLGLSKDGFRTARPILVSDTVRYVGDLVAFVVAETFIQARDAAEAIQIEYEELPVAPNSPKGLEPGAPTVWADCKDNICFTITAGDEAETRLIFDTAPHRVSLRLKNARIAANPLEPRATLGSYDPSEDCYTLYSSTQTPHALREQLARSIFGIAENRLRVVSPDVGGGFGMKSHIHPEDALVLWASRRCGRPVRWLQTRSDMLVSDYHGRDEVVDGELALDAEGKILGLRAHSVHWIGAYIGPTGPVTPMFTVRYTPGIYDIQKLFVTAKGAFSNTAPTHVYRGPGRVEGNYLIERLIDEAAAKLGIAPDEIRRKNAIRPEAMPYKTPTGSVYDSCEFMQLLEKCKLLADWDEYKARHYMSSQRGLLRGRSVIFYIEHAGIYNDRMEIRFDPSGALTIVSGLHSHGQGHATTFAQMVSEWLGVPIETIRLVQGDTDKVSFGRGTYSARSAFLASKALKAASETIIDKARMRAAELFEAQEEDVKFVDGVFSSSKTNRTLSIVEVAKSLFQPARLDGKYALGLEAIGSASADNPSYPNGCHICEVEIDPEIGQVTIDRYSIVDDVGRAINPMICEGQILGGLAQGIGQAMFEEIVYDDSGQMMSGSLMDYGLPRADCIPPIKMELAEFPTPSNPLGLKGVGESGIIGTPAAIANAVIDALRPLGINNVDMPFTPYRIWRAIQGLTSA